MYYYVHENQKEQCINCHSLPLSGYVNYFWDNEKCNENMFGRQLMTSFKFGIFYFDIKTFGLKLAKELWKEDKHGFSPVKYSPFYHNTDTFTPFSL